MNLKRLTKKTEFYVAIILVVFCALVEMRSGQFLSGNNIVDLLRSLTIPTMFCVGEMMVLISGGVDCSFPAIASLSMYFVCTKMDGMFSNPLPYFLVAILLGLIMGAVNGFIVAKFKFPAMIVTLGTSSLFLGIMQGLLGSSEYPLTQALYDLGSTKVFTATNAQSGLTSDLPIHFVFMVILIVLTWLLMNKTMLGRSIYAVGGDEKSAARAGFHPRVPGQYAADRQPQQHDRHGDGRHCSLCAGRRLPGRRPRRHHRSGPGHRSDDYGFQQPDPAGCFHSVVPRVHRRHHHRRHRRFCRAGAAPPQEAVRSGF